MTSKDFNIALDMLGLNHSDAAGVLGVGRRSILRYAAGDAEIPDYVARLIILLKRHGVPREFRNA